MLIRLAVIQPDLISRAAAYVRARPDGARRAAIVGAQLGLLWAIVGRVWMRLISEQRIFSVPGTLFILIVVSGFGAAAGYAFARRRTPSPSRLRRWWHRLLAYVPFLGMGPFAIFFVGQLAFAWRMSHPRSSRLIRWILAAAATLATAFWTLVFISQDPAGPGWASALLYLILAYILYLTLRFTLAPGDRTATTAGDPPQWDPASDGAPAAGQPTSHSPPGRMRSADRDGRDPSRASTRAGTIDDRLHRQGHVAKWQGRGLQNPYRGFDSRRGLQSRCPSSRASSRPRRQDEHLACRFPRRPLGGRRPW
jgi:hypothetical protein